MTLLIVTILVLAYLLIATENLTNINKAAVAIFAAALGWVLYICYGTDFVMSQHNSEYLVFLGKASSTSASVKHYIAQNIFLPYVGRASEVVLFLLATMTIVEILNNNGCFDFVRQLLRTRNSRKMLWTLSVVTFIISANLDNLSTTVMMLTIMHSIIPNRRQRMIYGSAIVVSANCGGALTVIGNPEGLVLWNLGAVTATNFSAALAIPCVVAWSVPTYLMGRMLPEHVDTEWITMPYRGDDTRLNIWQRLLMLFVGIGGLWFIPTFRDITKLSPFLGAMCVLAILWIVNEIFNRKLMNSDMMAQRRIPQALQYGVIQMMLYVMGMMLAIGVVVETGAIEWVWTYLEAYLHNSWIYGLIAGAISSVVENFATAMSFFSLSPFTVQSLADTSSMIGINGAYWKIIAFSVMAGGNILAIGSISGVALLKMEKMHLGWYFRNVGWKCLLGMIAGLVELWIVM
jgi:Na+/H+ antiporter NhaD/arsenite permease-like protein